MRKALKNIVVCLVLGILNAGVVFAAPIAHHNVDRLSRSGAHGRIAVSSGERRLPGNAEVSFTRVRGEDVEGRIAGGLSRRRIKSGASSAQGAARRPKTLAMYDISIAADGGKWQPAAGEPVQVTVELAEPVAVAVGAQLAIVHVSDDGAVEELPASRYGFTLNAEKTEVTAFWFSATGFSIYSIVDKNGDLATPRRFYHFYDHPQNIEGSHAVKALPYLFHDQSNDVVNVQIAKSGDAIKAPPIPPDVFDDEGNLVSMFEGWYVVSTNARPANAVESKLDATNEYFQFTWPVGVTGMRLSFTNAVIVTETEDVDYFVVPLYEHARFLQFNETTRDEEQEGGGARIIGRKLVAINDESGWMDVKVSDVSAALVNSMQEYFCGWRYKNKQGQWEDLLVYAANGQPQDQYVRIDDALFEANGGMVIPLYPVYVSAHFLNFDTNAKGSGATYVGSIFVRSTSEFGQVDPSGNRSGYDFAGWYSGSVVDGKVRLDRQFTDASGNFLPNVSATLTNAYGAAVCYTDANGCIKLNADVTLYAGWVSKAAAPYRVIIWQQRVTDAYDAADSDKTYYYTTHYTSGTVASTTQIEESLFTNFTGTRADGASISAKNLKTLSGAASGNAANKDFTGFHYSRFTCDDATVEPDGTTVINVYYDRNVHVLTFQPVSGRVTGTHAITNLYEGSIKDYFPIAGVEGIIWKDTSEKVYKYTLATLETMPDSDVTFSGEYRGSTYTIDYYVQVVGNDAYDATFNNKHYKLHKTVKHKFNYLTYDEEFHPIAGFSRSYTNADPTFSYDSGKGGYVASIPSSHVNKLYYDRRNYELIYCDGDAFVYRTGEAVPYESPLTGYNLAVTNSLLNWAAAGRDTSVGTFEGWYEDASLTVKFDFNHKMSHGTKFLYAKWVPIKHKVIVDPNGGVLQTGDSTWFYLDEGEKLLEYNVTREFRLDMHNGTYYYHHDLWDPVNDPHTDQYDPANSNAPRRAYYTLDISEATSNEVSNPENRYSYEPKAYAFMGWHEVFDDGTMSTDPFNFTTPPNRPVTIRALWRRTGIYTLKYESIDPDGRQDDQVILDPVEGVDGGYIDDAVTTMAKDPTNYDKNNWVWEGWQVVDTYNGNIPLTNIRSPGDVYVVHEGHADRNNVIHFRAVYKFVGDGTSRHIPPVTDLILDSNENAGLVANAELPAHDGRTGSYTDGAAGSVGGLNKGVWFAGQQNNFSVNLEDYSAIFAHTYGYFLLGWDPLSHIDSLIPKYTAVQTIGVDVKTDAENTLYAVWEPQVYIELTNATDKTISDVTLYIPSWIDGEVFRANTVKSKYDREVFSAFVNGQATFDLAPGESLRLVLPDGADRDFAVYGDCNFDEGTKLVATRIEPTIEGQDPIPDVTQTVYPGDHYQLSGTMKICPDPVQVVFTKDTYQNKTDVPVRYFLHNPDGTVEEITTSSASWETYNSVKKTLTGIGGSNNDIAALLQKSPTESVHEYLASAIRAEYGYTTIGIGAATGAFDEWRSITKGEPSGGSYIRFYHEKLEWSRYAQIWNDYQDAAVYVVFYKRIPVHVTIGKTVVGSEEDKSPDNTFGFSVTYSRHAVKVAYTKTIIKSKKRTLTSNRNSQPDLPNNNTASNNDIDYNPDDDTSLFDWTKWDAGSWGSVTETSGEPKNMKFASDQTVEELFPERSAESFELPDGRRHPLTIYYSSNGEGESKGTLTREGQYTHTFSAITDNGKNGSSKRYYTTQTVTWQETVPMEVTYWYETAVVTETALSDKYTLTRIGDDPSHDSDRCQGVADVLNRTYTISSINSNSINPVPGAAASLYDFTLLDTAIFTNTRKTGDLTISKTVVDGDAGDTFPFIVTLGETVVDKDHYTAPAGVHLGPYGKVFSFQLEDKGSVTLRGLPAGASYTVEEVAQAKYVATIPANATGAITADSTISVGVTNTRKADLVITMKDRTAIFTGEEQHGHEISSVIGTGSTITADGYTVTGLKNGHVLTVEHYVLPHGTAVGSYTGHVENVRFTVLNANAANADVTDEYVVTMTPGALTIDPTPIIVKVWGNRETKVYNGTDQECQGYRYEIRHATTDDVLTNDNVFVAIPVEYQTAWCKNVGRSEMHLQANHVVVTVPEGMSVSGIEVVENGWLEITPKEVTVTVNPASKLPGGVEPAYTATVDGTLGGDALVYTIGRTAGNLGETPGTYAVTASGEADQGNYHVTYVDGTLTIANPSLTQRVNGEDVDVVVPFTAELLDMLGLDSSKPHTAEEVAEYLNSVDPNGLRRWENLVTGTDPGDVQLGTMSSADATSLTVNLVPPSGVLVPLGYKVLYELRRNVNKGWSRVDGPRDEPGLNIKLLNDNGTSANAAGFYRVYTLLVPNNELSVTNELPCTNVIGVLEVNSPLTNTMTAVPWTALAHDPAVVADVNVAVQQYVLPQQLTVGDALYTLTEDKTYQRYTLEESGIAPQKAAAGGASGDGAGLVYTWRAPSATVTTRGTVKTPSAEERTLPRGSSVWVSRSSQSLPYFLIGQYTGEDVEVTVEGSDDGTTSARTMITNPSMEPLAINDIDWGANPTANDVIWIPTEQKIPTALLWKKDPADGKYKWGILSQNRATRKSVLKSDWTVPAGMGFWYNRRGAAFTVTVPTDRVDD